MLEPQPNTEVELDTSTLFMFYPRAESINLDDA